MGLPGRYRFTQCRNAIPGLFPIFSSLHSVAPHNMKRNNPMDAIGVRIVDNATVLPRETG